MPKSVIAAINRLVAIGLRMKVWEKFKPALLVSRHKSAWTAMVDATVHSVKPRVGHALACRSKAKTAEDFESRAS
jgi:hypothetical protein